MYRSTKQQQKELESIKLATAKQYALMRYFAKIERFLKLEKIDNVGFKISSLTEVVKIGLLSYSQTSALKSLPLHISA